MKNRLRHGYKNERKEELCLSPDHFYLYSPSQFMVCQHLNSLRSVSSIFRNAAMLCHVEVQCYSANAML